MGRTRSGKGECGQRSWIDYEGCEATVWGVIEGRSPSKGIDNTKKVRCSPEEIIKISDMYDKNQ